MQNVKFQIEDVTVIDKVKSLWVELKDISINFEDKDNYFKSVEEVNKLLDPKGFKFFPFDGKVPGPLLCIKSEEVIEKHVEEFKNWLPIGYLTRKKGK